MKKLFAKLALFTFASIVLAMPLQAFAENLEGTCLDPKEKKLYIITVVEEAFGSTTGKPGTYYTPLAEEATGPPSPDDVAGDSYQSRMCCRVTETKDGVKKSELNKATTDSTCPSPCPAKTICDEVMVILSTGGTTMIEGYIAAIYTWAASLVGLISVTVIIISGIQIAMSGGDTQAVDSGKTRIIKSLSGLAVLFLAGLILYTINPNFFTK